MTVIPETSEDVCHTSAIASERVKLPDVVERDDERRGCLSYLRLNRITCANFKREYFPKSLVFWVQRWYRRENALFDLKPRERRGNQFIEKPGEIILGVGLERESRRKEHTRLRRRYLIT